MENSLSLPCPAYGCPQRVTEHGRFCRGCWKLVPGRIKYRIMHPVSMVDQDDAIVAASDHVKSVTGKKKRR